MNFVFPLTKIMFGDGVSTQIGSVMLGLGCKRVLTIYDPGVKDAGLVDPLVEIMRNSGLEVIEYGNVQVSVPLSGVHDAAAMGAESGIDGIVAIGGGSAMDTGKAVNVCLTQPGDLDQYVGTLDAGLVYGPLLKPYACIPTTAGTGSEVSPIAVVFDEDAGVKKVLPQHENVPKAALVDPLLHVKMPPGLTASTGLDALSHTIEGIGGINRNPMLTAWGMTVLDMIFTWLPKAVADGSNLEAREKMALAATFGIMVGCYGGFHLPHAFGHSIEALTHVPHGTACAFALPEVVEFYSDLIQDETRQMASMLGVDGNSRRPVADVGHDFKEALRSFYLEIGSPRSSGIIPDSTVIDPIVDLALGEFTYMTAIKRPSRQEMTRMLESAWDSLR